MVFLRLENIEIGRNVPETKGASKREDKPFFGTGEEEVHHWVRHWPSYSDGRKPQRPNWSRRMVGSK